MRIRNQAQLRGDYINILTLMRKLGFPIHSFTSQNILREVERESISQEERRGS